MVRDTDGSAFITKAEFDSLKNNFQAQIDNYNTSIDSKIDGAIAAYLAGISLASHVEYRTVFGVNTTKPFYIYKDVKSAYPPLYYADAGVNVICAMAWGQTADSDSSFCALTVNYDGLPVIGTLSGSWDGSTTSKVTSQMYYDTITPEIKFNYGAANGVNCGGGWGKNSGYLRTEFTLVNYRAGRDGTPITVNGSRVDKEVNDYSTSRVWHFGSDSTAQAKSTLSWLDIPNWSSAFTFCGGAKDYPQNDNKVWDFKDGSSTKASFAVCSADACIPLINTSRDYSGLLRVQDRICVAPPAGTWETHAVYNLTKSTTGKFTTETKDKPRDPLWCRTSYWPYDSTAIKNNTVSGLNAEQFRNSSIIPVGSVQTETLISDFRIEAQDLQYTIWSGCPIYVIQKKCNKCDFTVKLDKAWDGGLDIKFKLRIITNKTGFSKSQITSGFSDKFKVDGVDNDGNSWITSGEHSITLSEGLDNGDAIWVSWITDTSGDGGKLIDCSDYATAEVEN